MLRLECEYLISVCVVDHIRFLDFMVVGGDLFLVPSVFVIESLVITIATHMYCENSLDRKMARNELILIFSFISIILLIFGVLFPGNWLFILSFGIEVGFCVFELLLQRPLSVETLVHHMCTIGSISFSLIRPSISINLLAFLNGSVVISNATTSLSRLLYHRTGSRFIKSRGLFVSWIVAVVFRLVSPVLCASVILTDLFLDPDRPEYSRIFSTSVLILVYLNFQLTAVLVSLWCRNRVQKLS